jgi:hypothetical protein
VTKSVLALPGDFVTEFCHLFFCELKRSKTATQKEQKMATKKERLIAAMPLEKKCVLLEMLLRSVKEDLERLRPGAASDLAPIIVAYLKACGGRCVHSQLEDRFEDCGLYELHIAIETLDDLGVVMFKGAQVYLVRDGVQ